MCSGPYYDEALHPTHQQIQTESHTPVEGIRTVVSQLSDQQQAVINVALASSTLVDQAGHCRFCVHHYMGSLNTVDVTSRSIRHTLVQDHHR